MINYYQPFLLPFLRRTPYRLPQGIRQTYFISFEDALWVLLRTKNIPKNAPIFIPDFYCMDVVDNIRSHGYKPMLYHIDRNFRCHPKSLTIQLSKVRSGVVIIFHACGIPSMKLRDLTKLMQSFPHILFIEDTVQKLIDPEQVKIIHTNHVVIDSLRKVSPLPGSFLYQNVRDVCVTPDPRLREFGYVLGSIVLFILFRALFTGGMFIHSAALIRFAHTYILKRHDNLIGDSIGGYRGLGVITFLHRFINFQKIQRLKSDQVSLYLRLLSPLLKSSVEWSVPTITKRMYGNLHVFPIILSGEAVRNYQEIETFLYEQGIVAWFKFPDAPWSNNRMVLFLPLGFHMTKSKIMYIANKLHTLPMNNQHTV